MVADMPAVGFWWQRCSQCESVAILNDSHRNASHLEAIVNCLNGERLRAMLPHFFLNYLSNFEEFSRF
jgi:hypothetical protein